MFIITECLTKGVFQPQRADGKCNCCHKTMSCNEIRVYWGWCFTSTQDSVVASQSLTKQNFNLEGQMEPSVPTQQRSSALYTFNKNSKSPHSVMMMNMQAVNFFCHSLGERRRRARQSVHVDWIPCCRGAKTGGG